MLYPQGVRPGVRASCAVLVGLALVGAFLHVAAPAFVARLAAEDGPLENAQALCFLAAATVCGWGLVRRRASPWAWAVGLASLVLLGEELSWGQRLLGFTSPAAVAEHNRQHEFNVHNLAGVNESIRDVGVVLLLVAFIAVPLLFERSPLIGRLAQRLQIVVPGTLCTTTALLAIAYMRIPRWLGRNDYGFDESGELFLAGTVLTYAVQLATARGRSSVAQPAGGRDAQQSLTVELLY